ncbi:MAG: hypothetical protein DDT35_01498 [Firmicutes bacterium]|nr:hypothetical protein [Bacillota bacterium]
MKIAGDDAVLAKVLLAAPDRPLLVGAGGVEILYGELGHYGREHGGHFA